MSSGVEPLPTELFREVLEHKLADFAPGLDEEKRSRLARFLSELDRWRRTVNLTGHLSSEDLASHALESALGADLLPSQASVVDIGTGGGFPGVPLAICRPDLRFTWLEPREKRLAFLRHLVRAVPVENADVIAGRVEELPAAGFESATSRGLKLDGPTVAGLLRPGGSLLLWTTDSPSAERALLSARFRLEQTLPLPGTRHRVIALFRRN
ncbi:MAG TPA: 16S rRNA (guanine(527)-N(7))-methyltransferase RsmG [Thermoanaerobaculia bacterium]|jgi:16S rRNA (guanine527-N7)-methyltransferase